MLAANTLKMKVVGVTPVVYLDVVVAVVSATRAVALAAVN
tara:strand:+ start:159 stop:278 length:120 start_codon:yes stop_codon:yes gene_type:complete